MQQPSAQGIASLFRGNPAPLQQRIQNEQQGKPGLPPDLQKLLALNIVTNEKDAVAKQQAMSQLAQMQGPQGQPPTVMETVQAQAQQKMQAEMQQPQGIQGLMPQAAPAMEAQGIDQLPAEFQMAEGGIIAFKKGGDEGEAYETRADKLYRENRGELTEEERRDQVIREALINQIPSGGEPTVTGGERVRGSETERNILNTLAALPGAGAAKATMLGRQSLAGLAALFGSDKASSAEKPAAPPAARPPVEASYSNEGRTGARPYTPEPKAPPVSNLQELAEADARKQQLTRRPAPTAPAPAPVVAAPQPAPVQESDADKMVRARMNMSPEAESTAAMERRRAALGEPDTSVYDRQVAELEKRKAQLDGPQDSYGQLMEYLNQIAATPRGMSSFEAGAAGAGGLRKMQQGRQLEQFDLSKQALAVSQKKLDTVRSFATEQYNVGESKFNSVYKEQYDAAKEISKDESEARKLAQQNTLKRLEMEQEATLSRERMRNSLAVANIGQEGRRSDEQRNQQYLNLTQRARQMREAGDTAGADRVLAQANDILSLKGGSGTAAVGAGRNKIMDRRQSMTELEKIIKDEGLVHSDADKANAAKEYRRLAMLNVQDGEGGGGGGGGGPKIGDTQQGYRFKGGNPADQSNWEKVK